MAASRKSRASGHTVDTEPSLWSSLAWGTVLAIVASVTLIKSGILLVDWSAGRPKFALAPNWKQLVGERLVQLGAQASNGSPPGAPVTSPGNFPSLGQAAPPSNMTAYTPPSTADTSTIKIASFNIQVFGESKLSKPDAMNVLVYIIRLFDVVAIQEVRSTNDNVVPTFVSMINNGGYRYNYVIGPRLGRTNSKEQYAMIYNTDRIEVDPSSIYETPDPQDFLHREPLVARFRVRTAPSELGFTFSLVDIHTDHDETKTELDALADVYLGVQRNGSGEDDVILLGDLNVDEYHLGNLGRIPNIAHAISGVTTNTRRNKMYDNIVFDQSRTTEYTRRSGVVDLMSTFNLTEAQALEVSDHCPVWAEFSVFESQATPTFAGRPMNLPR